MSPKKYYWHDKTPAGVTPMMQLYPREQLPPEKVVERCKAIWPDKGRELGIQLNIGDYRGYDAALQFTGDHKGTPTIEDVANHVRNGRMLGNEQYRKWWQETCEAIDQEGYSVDLVFCDFEGVKCTRDYKYKDRDGNVQIKMLDVIDYLYEHHPSRLPAIDPQAIHRNPYDASEGGQAMLAWNHWIAKKTARRWKSVFSDTAHDTFGEDCTVAYYDFASYAVPVMELKTRYARPNVNVDGVSCPVLYLKDNEYYQRPHQAEVALDLATGREIVPVIAGPHRIGTKGSNGAWLVKQGDIDRQLEQCECHKDIDKVVIY